MKLSGEDVVPVLAILAAGSFGVALTVGAFESRRASDEVVTELQFEYWSRLRGWAPPQSAAELSTMLNAVRDVSERVESLQLEQREIRVRVAGLRVTPRDQRREEIRALRLDKDLMVDELEDLTIELARLREAEHTSDARALGLEVELACIRLTEKVRYSGVTAAIRDFPGASTVEEEIEADIRSLREQLALIDSRVRSLQVGA
jgi:chromosome segregation ATPase